MKHISKNVKNSNDFLPLFFFARPPCAFGSHNGLLATSCCYVAKSFRNAPSCEQLPIPCPSRFDVCYSWYIVIRHMIYDIVCFISYDFERSLKDTIDMIHMICHLTRDILVATNSKTFIWNKRTWSGHWSYLNDPYRQWRAQIVTTTFMTILWRIRFYQPVLVWYTRRSDLE